MSDAARFRPAGISNVTNTMKFFSLCLLLVRGGREKTSAAPSPRLFYFDATKNLIRGVLVLFADCPRALRHRKRFRAFYVARYLSRKYLPNKIVNYLIGFFTSSQNATSECIGATKDLNLKFSPN